MAQKIYHGDPSREHKFWIYPRHQPLINTQWDAYDPHDLCNNFTLINGFSDIKEYRCNGHQNEWSGSAGCSYPDSCGNVSMSQMTYHGDPTREHKFWVYPRHQSLINAQWDTYDPAHLCNNFTALDRKGSHEVRAFKCNGHPGSGSGIQGLVPMPQMTYHGDPTREHKFWVYPRHQSLINAQWDTYDPTHLCNNFTALDRKGSHEVRAFKCNGHPNVWPGAGGFYPAHH